MTGNKGQYTDTGTYIPVTPETANSLYMSGCDPQRIRYKGQSRADGRKGSVETCGDSFPGFRNTGLQPGFYFTFQPAGTVAQFNRFRKLALLYLLVKPLIR